MKRGSTMVSPAKEGIWSKVGAWLSHFGKLILKKTGSAVQSLELTDTASVLPLDRKAVDRLQREWKSLLTAVGGAKQHQAEGALSAEDRELVEELRSLTEVHNRNNVTRTAAYWKMYRRHPELHWAFLAHMVSRNGGWSMTDLQGELLPSILDAEQRRDLFLFLERANALIFQDAYPQLLLYEYSKKRGRSLFRLLPYFHVSGFMGPVWEVFWEGVRSLPDPKQLSPLLTVCLIINEQHYIEDRVVRNPYFKTHVLDTPAFQAQAILQMNQVFFPYGDGRLAGLVLESFSDLQERISVGKSLYGMLFGIPEVLRGASAFAASQPHTGSRADYSPGLFTKVRKAPPSLEYTEKLDGCKLREGASPLYSPPLTAAWKDHPVEPPERFDWFRRLPSMELLTSPVKAPVSVDMTGEACFALTKLEMAVIAAQTVKQL